MIKKTTAIVAVVLFVILFTAGSVTAAYLIKSQTDVTDNTLDNEYIVISATDTSDFLGSAKFDTVVDGPAGNTQTITYKLNTDNTVDGKACAKISNTDAISFTVTPTGDVGSSFDLFVTCTLFTPVTGLDYIMTVGSEVATYQAHNDRGQSGWLFTSLALSTEYDVELYVAYTNAQAQSIDTNPGATLGFTNYQDAQNPGSIFTFVAEIPEP